MQTTDLQKMGLIELDHRECEELNGGWFWVALGVEFVRHLDDVYEGFKKGWNFDKK